MACSSATILARPELGHLPSMDHPDERWMSWLAISNLVGLGAQAHCGWPNEIILELDWTKSMEAFLQWMSDVDLMLVNALIQFSLWTAHEGDWMHRQLQELSHRIPVAYEIFRENK